MPAGTSAGGGQPRGEPSRAREREREVDFEHPPVNEVAFSVQFASEVTDEVGILASFLPKLRERFPGQYPGLEKQPPVPPASETFGSGPFQQQIQLQLLQTPPALRYWLLSADKRFLVQIQPDRFMFNWRAQEPDDEYPHYDTLRPRFEELLGLFLEHVAERDPVIAWCELQYVNPIVVDNDGESHGQLAHILRFLVRDPERTVLPPVEDTQLQMRFRIKNDDGEPIGRLYLSAIPALRATDNRPAYLVTLLARGRPADGKSLESAFEFFDRAHTLIVNAFKEVTTPEMRERWVEL